MASTPNQPIPESPVPQTPTPDIPPAIEPQVPPPSQPEPGLPDLTDDPPPETVNLSQEDESTQAQTYGEAAQQLDSDKFVLEDSSKPVSGDVGDDVQDLVDHMRDMEASGRIDMDAYRGERNDDDEEDTLGPAAARE